ncbi:MAG: hypothetical protein QOI35_2056 [Cryptosporangiaceae bacterium]|nr:hypothetical protein [Cryptosporangiaceae bacterium]
MAVAPVPSGPGPGHARAAADRRAAGRRWPGRSPAARPIARPDAVLLGRRWSLGYLVVGVSTGLIAPLTPSAVQEGLYGLLGVSVIAAVAGGLRLHRPARPLAWRLLLLAMVLVVVANFGWAGMIAAGLNQSHFSIFDVAYYAMYPALAAATAILPVHGRYGSPLAGMTEAAIITSTAGVLLWTLLVDPLVFDVGTLPRDPDVLAYPILDLMILSMGIRLILVTGTRARAHLFIILAQFALLAADIVYFVSVANGGRMTGPPLTVIGWSMANVLLGAAALHPSMGSVATAPSARLAPERPVALPFYVLLVLLSPAAGAYSVLTQLRSGHLDPFDVIVPIAGTMLTAVLLVARLGQLTGVAQRRATDLDTRTIDLEDALHRQHALQAELAHQALHDPLTGLPNRALLLRRTAEALDRATPGGLLMFDLDGFKDVNDRYGHPAGDALLIAVAHRIGVRLPSGSVLARLGGDEFAIIAEVADPDALAECATEIVATLRMPFEVQGHRLHTSASVGLRWIEPGAATDDLIRDADLALYAAKSLGKDQVVVFDPALREKRLEGARTVERLRSALDCGELEVWYQPIVALPGGRSAAVEALLRWRAFDGPAVPPDRFIPAAEQSGLIVPVGEWVLRQACRDVAGWWREHGTALSVNVSPLQLREPGFAAMVRAGLAEAGLPPSALILEITENVLMRAEDGIAQLAALRADGVRIALDDFGTGYSSLAYLRDLPIDALKIDRSFLPSDGPDSGQRTPLVRAIVELAGALGLNTIAEGVETAQQAALLAELGCQWAQGNRYGAAMTAQRIPALLSGPLAESA